MIFLPEYNIITLFIEFPVLLSNTSAVQLSRHYSRKKTRGIPGDNKFLLIRKSQYSDIIMITFITIISFFYHCRFHQCLIKFTF